MNGTTIDLRQPGLKGLARGCRAVLQWLTSFMTSRPCHRAHCPAGVFALTSLPCGVCAVVKVLRLTHDKAEALRRIGIREGCTITLLANHDPVLVLVENTRIALSHRLAPNVEVQTFASNSR